MASFVDIIESMHEEILHYARKNNDGWWPERLFGECGTCGVANYDSNLGGFIPTKTKRKCHIHSHKMCVRCIAQLLTAINNKNWR